MSGESIHEKLARVRRPRVRWALPNDHEFPPRELPFIIGVLANLSGDPIEKLKPLRDRKFISIDRDNFNDVMQRMTPGLRLYVENTLKGDGSEMAVHLKFETLDDFEPANIVRQVEPLNRLLENRTRLRMALDRVDLDAVCETLLLQFLENSAVAAQLLPAVNEAIAQLQPHPDTAEQSFRPPVHSTRDSDILEAAIANSSTDAGDVGASEVEALVKQIAENMESIGGKSIRAIESIVRQMDHLLSTQLAAIMHAPAFQKLEGTWRGLHYLIDQSETGEFLKLRVLNISKRELFHDLDIAIEFDQTQLFRKVYEEEFAIEGGSPYGALIGDYEFANHPEDIQMLTNLSDLAATAFCPFISAVAPQMFQLDSFQEIVRPRDLSKIFDSVAFIQWRAYRQSDNSRFVVLTCPRTLARLPYGRTTRAVDEFDFQEVELDAHGRSKQLTNDHFTWMNTAYVLGTKLTDAFAKTGLCSAIRGRDGGGRVDGLPMLTCTEEDGSVKRNGITEVSISDRRASELSDAGFFPLSHDPTQDEAVFCGASTTHKPATYKQPNATANARIAAGLPFVMLTSRLMQYLILIARDRVKCGDKIEEIQRLLHGWIHNLVCASSKPSKDEMMRLPLKVANVQIEQDAEVPGAWNLVADLQPFLPMEQLTAPVRFIASLPELSRSAN